MTPYRWFLAILAAGLLARCVYAWRFPPKTPDGSIPNIDNYVELASSIAETGSLRDAQGQWTAKREPGYPLVLGGAFKFLGKSYRTAVLLNLLISAGILLFIYRIGCQWMGPGGGLAASAIAAFYPPFIYYCAQPVREILMTLLDLSAVWILIGSLKRRNGAGLVVAAMIGAYSALTKTTYLPFGLLVVPMLIGWFSRRWKPCAVYAAAFIVAYSLWPIRNYRQFHRWILGSTTATGDHFYMFLVVPEKVGGTPEHYAILSRDPLWQKGYALEPIAREKFFWREGLRWVRRHPLSYLRIVAGRFFYDEWRFVPRPRPYEQPYSTVFWVSLLSDGWLIPLGFLGLLWTRFREEKDVVIAAYIFSIAFTYSLILTMIRYRLVLMPWFILFAVSALGRCKDWFLSSSSAASRL